MYLQSFFFFSSGWKLMGILIIYKRIPLFFFISHLEQATAQENHYNMLVNLGPLLCKNHCQCRLDVLSKRGLFPGHSITPNIYIYTLYKCHSSQEGHINGSLDFSCVYTSPGFIPGQWSPSMHSELLVYSSIALFSPHSNHLFMGLLLWASVVWIMIH